MAKKTQSTRKHGLSRLEKLLQASIRQELQIKALRRDLCALSIEFSEYKIITAKPLPYEPKSVGMGRDGSGQVFYIYEDGTKRNQPVFGFGGGGSGLDRNKP
jgi:hypothetical protein